MNSRPRLLFVVGATATGKSDLAVAIAEKATAPAPQIINCDSVQFFDGVEIGAAKPGPELLARARHHLVGHVPVGDDYTAGDFRRDALRLMAENPLPSWLAVGGSGFYVQALEKGMYDVPEIPAGLREELESEAARPGGLGRLYDELKTRDSDAAAKIAGADRYRILRALEILRAHPAETLTEIRARFASLQPPAPFSAAKIGIYCSRERLRERVVGRTRAMLARGLIREVESLRASLKDQGLKDWAPLRSVGYNEVQKFLDGQLRRDELEPAIVTSTMQLAKRQMTWFKRDTQIEWFESEDVESAVARGISLLGSQTSS